MNQTHTDVCVSFYRTCRDEVEVGIHVLLTLMVLCVCVCVTLLSLRSTVRLQRFFVCASVGVLALSFCPFSSRRYVSFFSFSFSLFFPHKFQGHWFTLASDSDAHAHTRASVAAVPTATRRLTPLRSTSVDVAVKSVTLQVL